MIRITRHGDPEIPVDGIGEQRGRQLLAGALRGRVLFADGHGGDVTLTEALDWPVSDLGMAALWLREVCHRTGMAEGIDPLALRIVQQDLNAWQYLSWHLGHSFLAGLWPYWRGGLEICCRECLLQMVTGMATSAAVLTAHNFSGDTAAALSYTDDGGVLPAFPQGHPPAADQDGAVPEMLP